MDPHLCRKIFFSTLLAEPGRHILENIELPLIAIVQLYPSFFNLSSTEGTITIFMQQPIIPFPFLVQE